LEHFVGWLWLGFILLIGLLLAFDLGVFHRKAHVVQPGEALLWSGVWIGLALLFNVFLYFAYERHWLGLDLPNTEPDGQTAALAFFTGYILEKSLSVDNIFIIALVFAYFAVPPVYQHRLLYWGILAALLMRGAMILVGVALIEQFHWLLYGFGVILIVTAIRMLFTKEKRQVHENRLVRIVRKWFPVTDDFEGQKFAVRRDGRRYLTPLALALVAVEGADLILAVDSIPAIFAVTEDPFLIFTSNVFAILGLRSLYFALAHVLERLHYLDRSLAAILALIGAKMLFKDVLHGVPGIMLYTLGAIVLILAAGVIASLVWPRPQTAKD
jgi:tellurite resistance protein TerC